MKKLLTFLFLVVPILSGISQDSAIEKESLLKKEISQMIENRDFVFNATDMLPRGGGVVSLGYDFDVQIRNDLIISYLPFFGKSYNVNFGDHNTGFDFTGTVENFDIKKRKKGYKVNVEVKNAGDHLNYTFHIKYSGFATLTLASSKRQSISYLGTIDPIK